MNYYIILITKDDLFSSFFYNYLVNNLEVTYYLTFFLIAFIRLILTSNIEKSVKVGLVIIINVEVTLIKEINNK